jgi:pimeloyl-ACP methyl ester carboxylesterase
MNNNHKQWHKIIGFQRDWVWRGWQIRYSYFRKSNRENNSKPPIIFIHGFGASIEHWRYNLAPLSENHNVYALDLLGFGGSRKVATKYNIDLWREQIYDFWQTIINQPVILVGHSIGSLVCLGIAQKYPQIVKGMVMITLPDLSISRKKIPKLIQPLVTIMENITISLPLIKLLLTIVRQPKILAKGLKMAYNNPTLVDQELIEIFAAPAYDQDGDQALYFLSKSANKPDYSPTAREVLPDLEMPILLLWGDGDRIIPPSLAQIFTPLNDKIKLVEFKNCGHCPHDEQPEQFNHILIEWLKNVVI